MSNRTLREVWDGRSERHAERKREKNRTFEFSLYDQSWWRHIEPLLEDIPGGRVLEAGCGPGRWVDRLFPLGFDMVLTDISSKMIEKAREFAQGKGYSDKIRFEVADIGAMDCLEDDSFDMAIATGEPVSMCSSPRQAVSELCRVVRPGGYVLFDAGNRYRRAYDLYREDPSRSVLPVLETGECIGPNGLHMHLLGPGELADLIQDLGMELLDLAGINPLATFPPTEDQKRAFDDPGVALDLAALDQAYCRHPTMVHLSQRLIAVVRKPA